VKYLPPWTEQGTISGDGSTIVARDDSFGTQAIRWTVQNGVERLGVLPGRNTSWAWAVSHDGATVVGGSGANQYDDYRHAFRWTSPVGMQDLGVLAGYMGSEAVGISADGSTITGASWQLRGGAGGHAVRWRAGQIQDLGIPSGFNTAAGCALNADGSVIVGAGVLATGRDGAFIWSEDLGIVSLTDHLARLGIDVVDWRLELPTSITPDGRTIVGMGYHRGVERGWIVTIPRLCGSADFDCDGDTATDVDIEAFFACVAGRCPPPPCPNTADFNGDGEAATDADIEAFFRVLTGNGC
jgi:probable HAF family extracellular repeat protein